MDLKCFKVTCVDDNGDEFDVGILSVDEESAKHCAERSLLEGRHIKALAVRVEASDGI